MIKPFQTHLPPGFLESLIADMEAEEDAIERLIAAHASGDSATASSVLDALVRMRGLPAPKRTPTWEPDPSDASDSRAAATKPTL